MDLDDLRYSVELALDMIEAETTLIEAEVCASWCECQTIRVQYDADHPDAGIQAPQSSTTLGIGILVVIADRDARRVGFGSNHEDVSVEGIAFALEEAKASAMADSDFIALPRPLAASAGPSPLHDAQILTLQEDEMAHFASEALDGALSTLKHAGYVRALHVSGDLRSRKTYFAVGNTHGILACEASTSLLATMRASLTNEQSYGTGSSVTARMQDFAPYDAGVEAAQHALQARGGITLAAADYPVILGPHAVADLVQDLLVPALSLDTVAAGTSPFTTRLGQQVASAALTMSDEGRLPGLLGSHTITGEGLPTGSTTLIDQGRLVGFLADAHHAQKLAELAGARPPRNGMRFATDGRSFCMRPGIFPTNITFASHHAVPLETLLAPLTEGVYVGGLWHTYPQGGLHTGAFTSTVVGPSFVIQHGKLAQPIRPGTLHLHDNFLDVLQRLTGLSTTTRAVALSGMQSMVLAPEVRCSAAHFVS